MDRMLRLKKVDIHPPKPVQPLTLEQIETFWCHVDKEGKGADECWPWISYRSENGYGQHNLGTPNTKLAHRIAYYLVKGQIPEGLTIDHLCFNKRCCNPTHMEPVPIEVNLQRYRDKMKEKGWSLCPCGQPRGAKDRRCRDCHNAYYREYGKRWRDARIKAGVPVRAKTGGKKGRPKGDS